MTTDAVGLAAAHARASGAPSENRAMTSSLAVSYFILQILPCLKSAFVCLV